MYMSKYKIGALQSNKKVESPIKRYWEWKAKKGVFSYYDKEKKQEVEKPGILCRVLGQCSFIRGWDNQTESRIYSNFVLNTLEQTLKVRSFGSEKAGTKSRVIAEGLYKDIKEDIKSSGGRYHKGLFIYNFESEALEQIDLKGSAIKEYGDTAGYNYVRIFTVVKSELKKTGNIEYYVPIWEKYNEKMETSEFEKSEEKAEDLQKYVDQYFEFENKSNQQEKESEIIQDDISDLVIETDDI